MPEPRPVLEMEEPGELTIERYLTGLLSYDPKPQVAEGGTKGVTGTTDAGEAAADSEASGPEDLEQFQNWLRSLKR